MPSSQSGYSAVTCQGSKETDCPFFLLAHPVVAGALCPSAEIECLGNPFWSFCLIPETLVKSISNKRCPGGCRETDVVHQALGVDETMQYNQTFSEFSEVFHLGQFSCPPTWSREKCLPGEQDLVLNLTTLSC